MSGYNYLKNARKVLCIGRNYAAHIAELNNVKPKQPFFFLKPPSSFLKQGEGSILIPKGVTVHYEVELAVILGKTLKNINPETFSDKEAIDAIDGYALSIDLTGRNIQDEAKGKGLPWSIPKGFDTFLPISPFIPKGKINDHYKVELFLDVNGINQQQDQTSLMIFPIHKILSHMSSIMTLEKGDIILTGTPKGVGPIVPGDKITAGLKINGVEIEEGHLQFNVEDKPGPYEYRET